jgi:F0F1-type ATP synthase assembly protein I
MSTAVSELRDELNRVLVCQALAVSLVAAVSAWLAGSGGAASALGGGAIALLGGWSLARGVARAGVQPRPATVRRALFGAVALRFAAMVTAFALALGLAGFTALPLLSGFAAGQLAYAVAACARRGTK